ncbi:hypothetical protein F5Y16DRAFT_383792 [Xylariaceae sp. FL0255]|nr:hypothetical protein F5Y16DRAFT_383792 [Xylariaceae sp. FL0255]
MEDCVSPTQKKFRKGTKSCKECRRRKIRCTWQTEDDFSCDGCLARGLSCRLQEPALDHNSSSTEPAAAASRDEILRLEQKLEQVTGRVLLLEKAAQRTSSSLGVGYESSPDKQASTTDPTTVPSDDPPDLPGGNMTHIRSLLGGAFVEVEGSHSSNVGFAPAFSRGYSDEHESLRRELLQLIPGTRDMDLAVRYAFDWWEALDPGIPPVSINSKQELRAVLERLKNPASDPALVALWLVTAAVTVQQVPPDIDRSVFEDSTLLSVFPESIMTRIDAVLSTHKELAATVWGIECSLILVKLQLNCGRVRLAWLTLRSAIACAELAGLPAICQSPDTLSRLAQLGGAGGVVNPSSPVLKASIWIQLCLLDRILGVLLNLPSTTRDSPRQLPSYLLRRNGTGRELFWALSKIAIRIRDRDESITFSETSKDWRADSEDIARELHNVAGNASILEQGSWFGGGGGLPDHSGALRLPHLYQHIYFYQLLRTQLPLMLQEANSATHATSSSFGLRPDTDKEEVSRTNRSHATCIYACTRMGRLYLQQVTGPTRGLFPMRISDFMAFTAIAVLMLEQEGALQPITTASSDIDGNSQLLKELISALKQAAKQEGRAIAKQAVKAAEAIKETLTIREDSNSSVSSIQIPLLGTVRLTRKARPTVATKARQKRSAASLHSGSGITQNGEKRRKQAFPIQVGSGTSARGIENLPSNSMSSLSLVRDKCGLEDSSSHQPPSSGVGIWSSHLLPTAQSGIDQPRNAHSFMSTDPLVSDLAEYSSYDSEHQEMALEPQILGSHAPRWIVESINSRYEQSDGVTGTMNMDDSFAQSGMWAWSDDIFGAL